jgi:hypothetical protein
MSDPLEFVTFCGLCCHLCAERTRIPQRAAALREAMDEEGWPSWGTDIPDFGEFWRFLGGLAEGGCAGCRAGGGPPFCQIRVCAQERGVDVCVYCTDFPCVRIAALNAIYPTLISDARRLQVVGLEQWLHEQEQRARRGVVYADLRHEVDEAVRRRAFGEPE